MSALNSVEKSVRLLLTKSTVTHDTVKKWSLIEQARIEIRTAIKDGIDIAPIIELVDEIDRRWRDAH